jgi:hypothetical protein
VQSLTEIDNVLENTHGINDTNRAKILNSIKLAKQRKPNLNLTNHHGKSGVTIRTEKTTNFEDILADKLVNGKYKGIDPQNIVKITKTIKAKDINTLLAHGDLSPAQRDKLQGVLDAKHQSQ